jgi:hypothetical protein
LQRPGLKLLSCIDESQEHEVGRVKEFNGIQRQEIRGRKSEAEKENMEGGCLSSFSVAIVKYQRLGNF